MQIIIPMSGFGKRFVDAGYKKPKPLIEVDGKPIIGHVIDMFKGEKDFIFICNRFHLENTNMRETLKKYCPSGRIIDIEEHKLGPIYAVSKIYDLISDQEETIVNYCDFTCYWDYLYFKCWVSENALDGCIPAYRGFHPHSLNDNNYAFISENQGRMKAIQEKKPFTLDKTKEFASSGTYYFAKGLYLKKYFSKVLEKKIKVNNEYYCSVAYNFMVEDGLSIGIYELQHFMQWGTPEDLREYKYYSNIFKNLINKKYNNNEKISKQKSVVLIPAAGRGSRFKKMGYKVEKPFLKVSEDYLIIQSTNSLPKGDKYIFITLMEHYKKYNLNNLIKNKFESSFIVNLNKVTTGQASTCLEAENYLNKNDFLTISACDHAVLYDSDKYQNLVNDEDIDIIVWAKRGHIGAVKNPDMYGWILEKNGNIEGVSVKKELGDPINDPIMIGTFTFKKSNIFISSVNSMLKRNGKINGEFYIDSCIEDAIKLGYKCKIFLVDSYICWGTPDDMKIFEYWQSCFHKWDSHPYTWNKDIMNKSNTKSPKSLYKFIPDKLLTQKYENF